MAVRKSRIGREKFPQPRRQTVFGTGRQRDHERSGVLALVRILGGTLQYTRRWQVWMRRFCICGRGFDGSSGRADSLLDFLLSGSQRIVRDVERAFCYFDFNYAIQTFDSAAYFLLASRSPSSLISIRAAIVSLKLESAWSVSFFISTEMFVPRAITSCIRCEFVTLGPPDGAELIQRVTAVSNCSRFSGRNGIWRFDPGVVCADVARDALRHVCSSLPWLAN